MSYQSLLSSEIEEVSGKIAALETIRADLEQGILKLREEDLELVEECAFAFQLSRVSRRFVVSGTAPDICPPFLLNVQWTTYKSV